MNAEQFVRRRPVYLLLDTSGSMRGAPIQAVQQGVTMIHQELLNNPHAIETVYLSVITFADGAQQVAPLASVENFNPPTLRAEGQTALGAAITLLEQVMSRELIPNTEGRKGDYRPLVFLLTDGAPTDDWQPAVARFKQQHGNKIGAFVALGCGSNVNTETLHAITNDVLYMKDTTPDALKQFFRWVSSSIQKTSQRIGARPEESGLDAPPLPPVMKWDRST